MKFESYKYERPNMDDMQKSFESALKQFTEAKHAQEQEKAIDQINKLRFDFGTMARLASIRQMHFTTKKKTFLIKTVQSLVNSTTCIIKP